jgi:hypothetical protein
MIPRLLQFVSHGAYCCTYERLESLIQRDAVDRARVVVVADGQELGTFRLPLRDAKSRETPLCVLTAPASRVSRICAYIVVGECGIMNILYHTEAMRPSVSVYSRINTLSIAEQLT